MRRYSRDSLAAAVENLEGASLLQRSDTPRTVTERALGGWTAWNPAAGLFHLSTKDVAYARDGSVDRYLVRNLDRDPVPSPLKRYPKADQLRLPAAETSGEFPGVLLDRRTWRSFAKRPLALSELATLLGLTWKAQRWLDLGAVGRMPLKTSPSGGGRHPIEAYVLAPNVDGLRRGLYHYRPDIHALERLSDGATRKTIVRYLADQWWFGNASVLVLMTAVFPRVQWRYRFPRAYRAVLVEAGHFCQTFCLVATWLGLAPFCSLAFKDSLIERDLGIDGVTESVLYAAGAGVRPQGTPYSPWPTRRRASSSTVKPRSAWAQRPWNSL
jgi:SagB-type dehydrogenase family enzyme